MVLCEMFLLSHHRSLQKVCAKSLSFNSQLDQSKLFQTAFHQIIHSTILIIARVLNLREGMARCFSRSNSLQQVSRLVMQHLHNSKTFQLYQHCQISLFKFQKKGQATIQLLNHSKITSFFATLYLHQCASNIQKVIDLKSESHRSLKLFHSFHL